MSEQEHIDLAVLRRIADRLQRSQRVAHLAGPTGDVQDIATEAALALLQIQRAARVLETLLVRLEEVPPEDEGFADVLDDVAEEFRLINYQITTARLFNYVVPE